MILLSHGIGAVKLQLPVVVNASQFSQLIGTEAMTRIDRYLILLYLRILFICFLSIAGLLIVVQVFSNLDEFLKYAEQRGSLAQVLLEYYGPFSLTIFDRLSGMIALMSLLFVVAWLYRTNEFVALMAAGVTKKRVVRPLLIASAVVILSASALREFSIPRYQDRLDRSPQDLTGGVPRPLKPTYDERAAVLLSGRHLLPVKQEIVGPLLRIHPGPLGEFGRQISATNAAFLPATGNRPSGYWLKEVSQPPKIESMNSVFATDGTPILLTGKQVDWLAQNECFLVSDIEFERLRGGSAWKQFASTYELVQQLQLEERGGDDLRVQIHARLLRPFIDWTLLLLGLPVLLMRPERHMFWVAGACLMIVSAFTAVVMGLAAVGSAGYFVSPSLSIWLPLIVFLPWGWMRTQQAMNS